MAIDYQSAQGLANMDQQDYEKILRMYCRVHDESRHVSCCLPCHFDYEEQHVFPYLAPEVQKMLKDEHVDLLARGTPQADVLAHAAKEMEYFTASGAPPEIIERIETDHLKFFEKDGLPVRFGNVVIR